MARPRSTYTAEFKLGAVKLITDPKLAVVEDLFRRMIVGASMDSSMGSSLVVGAREVGIRPRRPGAGARADRGTPYPRDPRVRARAGIVCRTRAGGPCGDRAPMGALLGRLKCAIESAQMFATRDHARAERFEYSEGFYNRVPRHSSRGFAAPVEFERAHNPTHP